jgi:3-oxoacyl-[acyl-carrier protein] reductase
MKRLAAKIAIVTGSSSGIGKTIALRLAEEGCRIVVAARRAALSGKVVSQIQERGGDAASIPTDVTDEAQVDRLIAETVKRFGRLDILVNNAGIGGRGTIAEMSTQAFDQVLNTNLRGTFFCCRAGFRAMTQTGGGIIINMSSVCGVDAWAGTGTYSASKYGVMGLTKALADEGRPHKIKACAICPGAVADELVDAPFEEIVRSGLISPFDIADTVLYLAALGPHATVHQIIVDRMGADW